jgi:peptidoglycan/xylan/chitin deacetylase (PgdA/CDA1 family)
MYHAVTSGSHHDAGQESVSAAELERQMSTLHRFGVRLVSLEDGLAELVMGSSEVPMASVVFDDGYVGLHDHAADVLGRHGVPATVFLATGAIGTAAFAWAPAGLGRPLTWAETCSLVAADWKVGSHTHDHLVLTQLSTMAARDQLRRSRACIEDKLWTTPRVFAYPYGSYGTFDDHTTALLKEEGFVAACTTVWGSQRRGDDPFRVRRIRVSWCDGPREIRKLLAGSYDWYRAVQRIQARRVRT